MSELNINILKLVKENKTFNDICSELKITPRILLIHFNQLIKIGYSFDKKYYDTGDIIYTLCKKNVSLQNSNQTIINLKKQNAFRFLVISDLHIGSSLENLKYLDRIYNYAKKNNIHTIINTGDLIDGLIGEYHEKIISDPIEQVKYAIKNYPRDSEILNYVLYGNHDLSILQKEGIDISKAVEQARHDLITVGKLKGCISIQRDSIYLVHDAPYTKTSQKNRKLMISGHVHRASFNYLENKLKINVPTLSDLAFNDSISSTGALDLLIHFKDGIINQAHINQLLVHPQVSRINELTYTLK